uniref:C-MYC n=1 Tax=Azumapecten farreri TaxID=106299 RepID=A0A2L2FQ49_AZUFA|nr:c-MYC [Azumapecten farreri]
MVVRTSKGHSHQMESEMHKCQTCDNGSTLCINIWNKFDLGPPTPPGSPPHETMSDFPELDGFNLSDNDVEFFDSREEDVLATMKHIFAEGTPLNLQSKLIQDCMWSGNLAKGYVDQKSCSSSMETNAAADCVDPTSVFPYPMHNITDKYMTETRVDNLQGLETPSDSEEEIDVVTVREQMSEDFEPSKIRKSTTIPARCIKTEREDNDYAVAMKSPIKSSITLKVKVDCPTDVHNYSLPHSHSLKRARSSLGSPSNSIPNSKRIKRELSQISVPEFQKTLCQKLSRAGTSSGCSSASSSRSSSDSEECCEGGKRTQHNVLERKRRNDLKYSFFTLRDSVPELSQQERAPKVLILKKAADHIHRLNHESLRLEKETDMLRAKNDQLRRTLNKLQVRDF